MSIILILIMSGIAAVGYYYGNSISLGDSWTYFEALRTTGAIVFGVMGALLAIVYPEVIKQGFRTQERQDAMSVENIHHIIDPLAQSAILLVLLVLLGPAFAWIKVNYADSFYARSTAFGLLCMLSAWQVWILILVLRPLDLLRTHTSRAIAKAKVRQRIHSNVQTK
jgi:hypothetical protein